MVDSSESWREALRDVSEALAPAQDPWWVIGSAAVALLGGENSRIADIDVIVSSADLDNLYERLPLTDTPEAGKSMFMSERFGRWSEPSLDIEFMAGLKLDVGDGWEPVQPITRQKIELEGFAVHVPERFELEEILRRFGRTKDLRRAASLSQ